MKDPHSAIVARAIALLSSFGLLALIGASASAAGNAANDTYTWSAELVAFDMASHTLTVKARMVMDSDKPTNFKALHSGDAAMLTWSGISTAAGVRTIERGSKSTFDRMTLPINYVSVDDDHQHVTFKVKIPDKDAQAISKVKPGAWITARSPQHTGGPAQAVSAIRPYGQGFAQ